MGNTWYVCISSLNHQTMQPRTIMEQYDIACRIYEKLNREWNKATPEQRPDIQAEIDIIHGLINDLKKRYHYQ